ncbi:MAG: hypothetical protein ACOYT7_03750 [Patescibacteria group bacterium]
MHEIARHWRLREHRLRLMGSKRELPDGRTEVSLDGRHWVEARLNGHHKGENPLAGAIIYQASEEPIAVDLPQEVEITSQKE